MKKYYIGLAVLFLLSLGLAGYVVAAGKDGKKDEETSKKVESIGNKLTEYLYQENKIPESLDEADIKDVPSTIKYEKLDEERFKFCAYYDSQSSGYDAGPLAFLTGIFFWGIGSYEDTQSDEEKSYLESYSLIYYHKEGDNCQTIKPYLQGDTFDDSNFQFDSTDDPSLQTD